MEEAFWQEKSGKALFPQQRQKYIDQIVGTTTKDGVEITKISDHAFDQIAERLISPKRILNTISSVQGVKSANPKYPGRKTYDLSHHRVVIDTADGTIVSVMWRRQASD